MYELILLVYSKYCKYSLKALELAKETCISDKIKYVSVDRVNGVRPDVVHSIEEDFKFKMTRVPILILYKSSGAEILYEERLFNTLMELKGPGLDQNFGTQGFDNSFKGFTAPGDTVEISASRDFRDTTASVESLYEKALTERAALKPPPEHPQELVPQETSTRKNG